MRIQKFIFSLVVFVFFDVIQAAEDPVLVKASEVSVSVNQVGPLFSHLLDSFLFKNINEAAFKSDFLLANELFQNFPLQTLRVINSFGRKDFIIFFAALINSSGFTLWSYSRPENKLQGIESTFRVFQMFIMENMKCGSDLISLKEVSLEILSILKSVSCSSSVEINFSFDRYLDSNTEAMSTKVFIHSYSYFIEGLEDDSVIGFENAYYNLKHLSIQYEGVIPSQEYSKSRIFSLIFSCRYYARNIKLKDFDPQTTDSGAISFFLKLIGCDRLESLFSSCGSVDKKFVRKIFKKKIYESS